MTSMRSHALGLQLVAVAALAWSAPAPAQSLADREDRSFSLERMRYTLDSNGIFDVEYGAAGANPLEYDVGVALGYALNPLVLNQRAENGQVSRVGALVAHRAGLTAFGSWHLTDWVTVGLEAPVLILQTRGDPIKGVALDDLSPVGFGDLRLVAKFFLLSQNDSFVDLALVPQLTLPTGFPFDSYMGEGFFTLTPEVAVSRGLFDDHAGGYRLRIAANVSTTFRKETNLFGMQVGHEMLWRVGVGYRLADAGEPTVLAEWMHRTELEASLRGGTSLLRPFHQANQDPLELLAGANVDIVPDRLQLFGGVGIGIIAGFAIPDARAFIGVRWAQRDHDRDGDGIKDWDDKCIDIPEDRDGFEDKDGCPDPDNDGDGIFDGDDRCPNVKGDKDLDGCLPGDLDGDGIKNEDDKCPTEPEDKDGFEDKDGCPEADNDGDGILDGEDKCPSEAEDKDDYEDADGCPDPDNDGDEILDGDDKCPNEPEDKDGDRDEDGCPDDAKFIVTKKKVFALEKIYFDFGKASIKRESLDVVDGVANILKEHPEIGRVRIEGHTDSVGSDAFNLQLSQSRTDSVRKALIERGIAADRLEAMGFGESRPIADNGTAEGRERNRRVEFLLIDQAAAEPAPSTPAKDKPADKPADDKGADDKGADKK